MPSTRSPMSARVATSSPSRPPQTQRPQHPRSQQPTRMRHAHNTPGIITLPQAKLGESGPSSASSASPSRHSSPRSTPPSSVDKPVPTVEQGEGKRRRRTKANRAETPLKAEAVVAAEAQADPPEQAANASDKSDSAGAAAAATPSKSSRRRRGRANRQLSPPLPDASSAPGLDQPAAAFPSTTPPRSDFAALAGHSRSVTPDPLSVRQHQHSLADAWDMPAVPQPSTDKPKQNLSWQQELLRSGSLGSHNTRNGSNGKSGDSPAARTRSRAAKTTSNPQPASASIKSRPPLTTSVSDYGTSTNPALNWQQEMLLRTDDAQLVQQQLSSANASSTLTPARQRRNQIKDSITFGLAGLDLSEDDADVFGSSASTPRRQPQQQQRARAQQSAPVHSAASTGYSTPVKVVPEARYAGPTFHNSPAPSSLPVPSFLLRRKAEGVAN